MRSFATCLTGCLFAVCLLAPAFSQGLAPDGSLASATDEDLASIMGGGERASVASVRKPRRKRRRRAAQPAANIVFDASPYLAAQERLAEQNDPAAWFFGHMPPSADKLRDWRQDEHLKVEECPPDALQLFNVELYGAIVQAEQSALALAKS